MTKQNQPQQTVIVAGHQSQALPALVNCFCFPGLGQLIQGRLLAAIVWWCLHLVGALSLAISIGFILWPIIWIACVIDAARYNPAAAQLAAGRGTSAIVKVLAAIFAIVVFVPVVLAIISSINSVGTQTADSGSTSPSASPVPKRVDSALSDAQPPEVQPSNATTAMGRELDVIESCELRSGPGSEHPRKVNEKASDKLGEIHYLTVDSSVTVRILSIEGEWAEIQVTQPDFLRATHRGWVPTRVLKDGPATRKIDGWIRNTCVVYPAPDTSQEPVGYLSPPSSVGVADDGSGWLRLIHGPIKNEGTNDFLESPQFDAGLYIEKSRFTTELPARWHRSSTISPDQLNSPRREELSANGQIAEGPDRARPEEDTRKAAAIEAAKWRMWTTADRKFTVHAKFVKFALGTVTLEKEDGTTVDVKLDILCAEDQDFVKSRKWTKVTTEQ